MGEWTKMSNIYVKECYLAFKKMEILSVFDNIDKLGGR
jgi:hypothetical protein